MVVFTAASHHDVLMLLLQISVLLFSARALGEVAQRLGQPSVVGEIMAGILLGPSVLGSLFPFFQGSIIPGTPVQGYLLEVVSMLGAMFLLLVTGLETDIHLIRRHARTAFGAAAGGLLVPLVCGYFLGQVLPTELLADENQRFVFSLFMATAMSISAIPVISKVLIDMRLIRRDIGQTIIAAAMIDDTVGWVLLSIVAGLAAGHSVTAMSVAGSAGMVFAFMFFSFTAGRYLVKKALDFTQDELVSRERLLTLVVVLTFAWAALTQTLKLEPVLGAFVMGILFGQMPRLPHQVRETVESIALGVFAPIFFAVAGLKVDILRLLHPQLLLITLSVILVATFAKVAGTYAGSRLIGKSGHWTALCFGAALNARGAMEIIVATIGLSLGILSPEMFSIIVVMAMVTSLIAPTALRWILAHVKPEEEESKRLRHEELTSGSPIAAIHRVLLPMRLRDTGEKLEGMQLMKVRIVEKIARRNKLSITTLSVADKEKKDKTQKYIDRIGGNFRGQEVVNKVVESSDPLRMILDEAAKFYHLLILGASVEKPEAGSLFSPIIDDLVRMSPCPTLVVHARQLPEDWQPRRILVPTNGSVASRRAAELAFYLADAGTKVNFLYVVARSGGDIQEEILHEEVFDRQLKTGHQVVAELEELGHFYKIPAFGEVRVSPNPEHEIINMALSRSADLIILSTDLRPASERLFLGPRVERILRNAPCPVAVLNVV